MSQSGSYSSPIPSPRPEPSYELKYKAKLEKLKRNQGWNTILDKELVRYQQKAWCYKRLHQLAADYYSTLDWIITMLIMIASISSLFPNQDGYIYIMLTSVATGLVGYQKMAAYSKLDQQHWSAHNNYGKYVTQLRNMLKLYRRDRPYAKQYIEFISGVYDDLAVRGPPIDGIIIWMFQYQYKNPKISMPDILSDNIDLLEKGIDGSDTVSDDLDHRDPAEGVVAFTAPIRPESVHSDDSENSDSDHEVAPQSHDKRRAYEINRLHAQNTFMNLNFTS